MIDTSKMTPSEIRQAAMDAVVKEVGVSGLALLLHGDVPKSGNYVEDRNKWLPRFDTVEDMMKAMKEEGGPESGRDRQD